MDALIDGVTYYVPDGGPGVAGLFHGDTRHLSAPGVQLVDAPMTLLEERRSPPTRRSLLYADVDGSVNEVPEGTKDSAAVLERRQVVVEGRFEDRIELRNHGGGPWSPRIELTFDADFADIFEVRGAEVTVDRTPQTSREGSSVTFAYTYECDDRTRTLRTDVTFDESPASLGDGVASFEPDLGPRDRWSVTLGVVPGGDVSTVCTAGSSDSGRREEGAEALELQTAFDTGNPALDETLAQAARDVQALTTVTTHGPVPLAGAPWFVTVFGRDALLAANLLLPVAPELARGTLRYLAAHRGRERDDTSEEAPGKILHEIRSGELAATGAIPHAPYFGTVDATPLWLVLLHETWRWTGDDALVRDLRPGFEAAVAWLERAAAAGPDDPFVYYHAGGSGGVVHKVWRDSASGVHYADGRQATPPLASSAVQGYVYDALGRAAELAEDVFDEPADAAALSARADRVAERFDEAYWMTDRDHYATALTDDGTQVDALTSNLGHCLWTGIVPPERTGRVADLLVDSGLFSGWGVRTTSADDDGFSPASYHAGSVWPHDNALAALGLARAGHHDAARTVADAQFRAFARFDNSSIPELFCGFDDERPPVVYPSGCRPQVWGAAAPFGQLRAVFDVEPSASGLAVGQYPDVVPDSAVDPLTDLWSGRND